MEGGSRSQNTAWETCTVVLQLKYCPAWRPSSLVWIQVLGYHPMINAGGVGLPHPVLDQRGHSLDLVEFAR